MEENPVKQIWDLKIDIPLTDPIVIGPYEVAMLAESMRLDIKKLQSDLEMIQDDIEYGEG